MNKLKGLKKNAFFWLVVDFAILTFVAFLLYPQFFTQAFNTIFSGKVSYNYKDAEKDIAAKKVAAQTQTPIVPVYPPLDKALYDAEMISLAHNPPPKGPTTKVVTDPKTKVKTTVIVPAPTPKPNLWPVAGLPYPDPGAILPSHRIIAYYGNLYSKGMGVLGQYPEDQMLSMLSGEVAKWNAADSSTPAIPALHYIAVTAQASPGFDGKYRARMPDSEIEKVIAMAAKINALVFLDVQVGESTVETEVPLLEKYLKLPNVHLGIDPEFAMHNGAKPGTVIGSLDATDINFAANYLAKIVRDNNLPPKVLIVHRFTEDMVTNYQNITPLPEVQIVMNMDGWGVQAKKINTYRQFIYQEPVQFTGFKLFYKNDVLTPGSVLMTPEDLLKLRPIPIYIQYQ